jgi:hypothetical protein
VRLGVVRVRGDRGLEFRLRIGDLAAVPQDDAFVVQRVCVAALERSRRSGAQLRRFRACLRGQIEFPLCVIDVRQAVVRLDVVRLYFDRFLVILFGLRVVLVGEYVKPTLEK